MNDRDLIPFILRIVYLIKDSIRLYGAQTDQNRIIERVHVSELQVFFAVWIWVLIASCKATLELDFSHFPPEERA